MKGATKTPWVFYKAKHPLFYPMKLILFAKLELQQIIQKQRIGVAPFFSFLNACLNKDKGIYIVAKISPFQTIYGNQ